MSPIALQKKIKKKKSHFQQMLPYSFAQNLKAGGDTTQKQSFTFVQNTHSAHTVFPAEVWADTRTDWLLSIHRIASRWKGSRRKGYSYGTTQLEFTSSSPVWYTGSRTFMTVRMSIRHKCLSFTHIGLMVSIFDSLKYLSCFANSGLEGCIVFISWQSHLMEANGNQSLHKNKMES